MNDNDIIKYFWSNKLNDINSQKYIFAPKEIKEYINNRYADSESPKETLRRIYLGIENRPVCEICGAPVKFNGRKEHIYLETCSKECASKLYSIISKDRCKNMSDEKKKQIKEKIEQTNLKRYGTKNVSQSEVIKEKIKNTFVEKYGSDCTMHSEVLKNKVKETNIKKYNSISPFGSKEIQEKSKITLKIHYSVNHPSELDSNIFKTNNPQKDEKIKEKTKQTNIKKYGGNSPTCDKNIFLKQRETFKLNHNGYSYYRQMPEHAEKMREINLNKETQEKIKSTNIKKYGVDSYSKTNEFKQIMSENINEINKKRYDTKKKNNTFNTSKPEDESYILIKEKYPDIIRQYKSNEYPFTCDFYIPSIDTYIECNYFWTHGKKPYNKNDIDCINLVNIWKENNTKFYNNAIITYTIRDVKKRNIAKENNLNWFEFFSIVELSNWLNTK